MIKSIKRFNDSIDELMLDDSQVEIKRILRNHQKNPNDDTLLDVIIKDIDLILQHERMCDIRKTLKQHERLMKKMSVNIVGGLLCTNSNMRRLILSYMNVINQRIRWFDIEIQNHDKIIVKSIKIKKELTPKRKKTFKDIWNVFKKIIRGEF